MKQSLILFLSLLVSNFVYAGICNFNLDRSVKPQYVLADSLILPKEDRVALFCDMRKALQQKYSLIEIKESLIGVNPVNHVEQCALNELDIEDNDSLKFQDRVIRCVAGIQDTHLQPVLQLNRPWTYQAFSLTEVKGKYFISSIIPKIISYVKERSGLTELDSWIAVGNEVLEVDGLPVSEWVEKLMPYSAGSSEGYQRSRALYYVTARNFYYPTSNSMLLKIRPSQARTRNNSTVTIQMPWWASSTVARIDANKYLDEIGIKTSNWLKWVYDEQTNSWKESDFPNAGFGLSKPLIPTKQMTQFKDDSGGVALRTGEVILSAQQVFCYMQILTFNSAELTLDEGGAKPVSFGEPIQNFINTCNKKQLPLLIDLRSNGGGFGTWPKLFVHYLGSPNKKYTNSFKSFRNSNQTRWLFSVFFDSDDMPVRNFSDVNDWNFFIDGFLQVLNSQETYLPMLNEQKIAGNPQIGGYKQKVVALITPHCVSACDMTAMFLKNNELATLVGTHTNGTGAGFIGFKINTFWADNYDMFKMRIPNFVFGMLPAEAPEGPVPFEENKQFVTENKPVYADVQYETQLIDLVSNGSGWLGKGVKELFKKEIQEEEAQEEQVTEIK